MQEGARNPAADVRACRAAVGASRFGAKSSYAIMEKRKKE